MDPDPRVRIPLIPDPDSSLFFSDAKKPTNFLTFLFIAYGTVGIFTSAFNNSKLFSCHQTVEIKFFLHFIFAYNKKNQIQSGAGSGSIRTNNNRPGYGIQEARTVRDPSPEHCKEANDKRQIQRRLFCSIPNRFGPRTELKFLKSLWGLGTKEE
jgi:hypothetical protein